MMPPEPGSNPSTDAPRIIMLMGLPRSGTTWLGKIFDSHPGTYYSHEPDSADRFDTVPLLAPSEDTGRYERAAVDHVAALRQNRTMRVVGKMPLFRKAYRSSTPLFVRSSSFVALKAATKVLGETSAPRFLIGSPDGAEAWVWKSIESSGRLGVLARALPNARAVFLIRHPCGVLASLLKGAETTQFTAGPASEDLGFFETLAGTAQARSRGLGLQEFTEMSAVDRTAWRWALLNEKAMADIDGLSQCKTIRYEDLCTDPLSVAKEVFGHAELDWNAQTERFVQASTTRASDAYYSVFKDPLVSAFKWKEELPGETIDRVLEIVSDTRAGRLYTDR